MVNGGEREGYQPPATSHQSPAWWFDLLHIWTVESHAGRGIETYQRSPDGRFLHRIDDHVPDRAGSHTREPEGGGRVADGERNLRRSGGQRVLLLDRQRPGGTVMQEGHHEERRRDRPES